MSSPFEDRACEELADCARRIGDMRRLLEKWRAHVADVFERRGRLEIYQPLEVFHTCHGCGGGAGIITRGLCPECLEQFNQAIGVENV